NLQTRGRNSPANFSIGTKGYWGVTSVADWWEYTPATDTWVQKASFPGGSRTGIASMSIGNLGYVGFGYVSNIGTNDWWAYNPTNNTWTQKASLPASGRGRASAFSIGGKGY